MNELINAVIFYQEGRVMAKEENKHGEKPEPPPLMLTYTEASEEEVWECIEDYEDKLECWQTAESSLRTWKVEEEYMCSGCNWIGEQKEKKLIPFDENFNSIVCPQCEGESFYNTAFRLEEGQSVTGYVVEGKYKVTQ